MTDLEQDFDSLLTQINTKLNEAADKLREVNELRKKAGLDALIFTSWEREEAYRRISRQVEESEEAQNEDFDIDEKVDELMDAEYRKYEAIDVRALERELSHAGWSTSSSYC